MEHSLMAFRLLAVATVLRMYLSFASDEVCDNNNHGDKGKLLRRLFVSPLYGSGSENGFYYPERSWSNGYGHCCMDWYISDPPILPNWDMNGIPNYRWDNVKIGEAKNDRCWYYMHSWDDTIMFAGEKYLYLQRRGCLDSDETYLPLNAKKIDYMTRATACFEENGLLNPDTRDGTVCDHIFTVTYNEEVPLRETTPSSTTSLGYTPSILYGDGASTLDGNGASTLDGNGTSTLDGNGTSTLNMTRASTLDGNGTSILDGNGTSISYGHAAKALFGGGTSSLGGHTGNIFTNPFMIVVLIAMSALILGILYITVHEVNKRNRNRLILHSHKYSPAMSSEESPETCVIVA